MMAEDMTARMMAMDAAESGGGGGGGDTYSRAEIDAKLDAIMEMLTEFVKRTDYANNARGGVVRTVSTYGIFTRTEDGFLSISCATQSYISEEKDNFKPLVSSSIPVFMENYGITSKTMITEILSRLDALDGGTSAQSHLESMRKISARTAEAETEKEETTDERTEDI